MMNLLSYFGLQNVAVSAFEKASSLNISPEIMQKVTPIATEAKVLAGKAGDAVQKVYENREVIQKEVKDKSEKAVNRTLGGFGGFFGTISKLTSNLAGKMTGKIQN